jgi:hypothetical protein
MKDVRSFLLLIFFGLFLFGLGSCGQKNVDEKVITKSNVEKVIKGNLNYVFITTEWCSASKSILKETYTKLCDSLSDDINLVLICASEKDKGFEKYLKEQGITCDYYVLPNKSSHEKIVEHGDRKRIRHFIKNNLKGYKELDLEWQFGVPVILYVDQNLKIISKAPQDYKGIKNFINQ